MLLLGRPVGAYPRLEARLAALRLGGAVAAEEEPAVEDTGCHECGGKKVESCDEAEHEHDGEGEEDGESGGDSDGDTKYAGSD